MGLLLSRFESPEPKILSFASFAVNSLMPGDANACIDAVTLRQVTKTAARTTEIGSYTGGSARRAGLRFDDKGMNGDDTSRQCCRQES